MKVTGDGELQISQRVPLTGAAASRTLLSIGILPIPPYFEKIIDLHTLIMEVSCIDCVLL